MAYKTAMHGRDHCPQGSDPIPCLGNHWARIQKTYGSALQSISGSNGFFNVYCGIGGDAINLGPGESGNGYFEEIESVDAGNPVIGLEPQVPGLYLVTCELVFNEVHNFEHSVGISDQASTPHMSPGNINPSQSVFSTFSTYKRWPAGVQVIFTVSQGSGAARNIDAAFMELCFIGGSTGLTRASLDPDQ